MRKIPAKIHYMYRAALPIDAVLAEVVAALRQHSAVVLRVPTGAGKTTRVAPCSSTRD